MSPSSPDNQRSIFESIVDQLASNSSKTYDKIQLEFFVDSYVKKGSCGVKRLVCGDGGAAKKMKRSSGWLVS